MISVLPLLCFTPTVAAAPTKTTESQSGDYAIYKKSSFIGSPWDAQVKEGFEAFDRENAEETINSLKNAVNLGCQSPLVYFKLAVAYESLKVNYSAIQYYELAAEKFKSAHQDHRYAQEFDVNYARALYSMGKKDDAIKILSKASSVPAWGLKLIAEYHLQEGRIEEALPYFEKLLDLSKNGMTEDETENLLTQVARVHAHMGNKDTAKKYYERVLAMNASNNEARNYTQSLAPVPKSKFKSLDTTEVDQVFQILNNH